jgi:hypothetical protein
MKTLKRPRGKPPDVPVSDFSTENIKKKPVLVACLTCACQRTSSFLPKVA